MNGFSFVLFGVFPVFSTEHVLQARRLILILKKRGKKAQSVSPAKNNERNSMSDYQKIERMLVSLNRSAHFLSN